MNPKIKTFEEISKTNKIMMIAEIIIPVRLKIQPVFPISSFSLYPITVPIIPRTKAKKDIGGTRENIVANIPKTRGFELYFISSINQTSNHQHKRKDYKKQEDNNLHTIYNQAYQR